MMKPTKKQATVLFALAGTLILAGGLTWRYLGPQTTGSADASRPAAEVRSYKYISLDKVIVMLRGQAGEPMTHYLAVDLVFKTPHEQEKIAKDHLPMLRTVAVKALSNYTLESAAMMSIDQFTAAINRAYSESYAREQAEKPFAEVMIGKLIIE